MLALMLLTFLGLTLAMTTSTELQIATNYRWGQQALYNAVAGIEGARAVLLQVGDAQLILPDARGVSWDPNAISRPVPASSQPNPRFIFSRNFEGFDCDTWANGTGYGQVLVNPTTPTNPYQNTGTAFGQTLNGGFTVWVRRELSLSNNLFMDNPAGDNVIVTSEGSAPYAGDFGSFQRANRAVRRLEAVVNVRPGCKGGKPETSDTGLDPCNPLPTP